MDFRPYLSADLPGILRLCEQEQWPSFLEDPARAHRVLTAPGVTTVVAVESDAVAGFAQMMSDGEIQAHLSLVAVDSAYRRRGIARELVALAFQIAGGMRVDLVTDGAEQFYSSFPHVRQAGFRIYPDHRKPADSD